MSEPGGRPEWVTETDERPQKPDLLPRLPNPVRATNGRVMCNVELAPGVHCQRSVRRDKGWHRGAHRVEWYSR